ncbi:acetylornithine deacetylase [Leisingera sp.]|uniref:acetylornithine deacetylase n=1 Tax=Leisingera sp. TaxID=1879318 RepID=UPI002B277E37|nr:acetylornithine deacetylase [Leisingera sp.]
MRTLEILDNLISFPTISRQPNRELLDYVCALLEPAGARLELVESGDGTRANLFATIGPQDRPGVVLSGHTDVVPAAGQDWSRDPFRMHRENGRCYGRGTADMKGFVAAAIAAAVQAGQRDLQTPLHLALSYDEEIGCVGVRSLIDALEKRPLRPALCIVGEPTGMRIASGHKGKVALQACCTGRSGHSALAPKALNALRLGAEFIGVLQQEQDRLAREGAQDPAYDIPCSTVHAGVMRGGIALNIVPDRCEIDFEIRNLTMDDAGAILGNIRSAATRALARHQAAFPEADIAITEVNRYPGLDTPAGDPVVRLLAEITGAHAEPVKVAFGTEGGLFRNHLGISTAICGPGHMDQGHKPDEYIKDSQLAACDRMLARLTDRLEQGL